MDFICRHTTEALRFSLTFAGILIVIFSLCENRPQDDVFCPLEDIIQVILFFILTILWKWLPQVDTDTGESQKE